MKRTEIYSFTVRNFNDCEYSAITLSWPSPEYIRDILNEEIDWLQQEGHKLDDKLLADSQTIQIWRRVDELKRLIDLLRVATVPEINNEAYAIPVVLGGRNVGSINVISTPAFE